MLAGSDLLDLAQVCLQAEGLAFWNQGWRFGIAPSPLRGEIEEALLAGRTFGSDWAASPGIAPGWLVVWFAPEAQRPQQWKAILSGFAQQLGSLGNDKLWRERFDLVADAVVLIDYEFRVQYVNRAAAEEKAKVPAEGQVGRCLFELYPEAENSAFHRAYQQAMESGQPAMLTEYYAPLEMWAEQKLFPDRHGLWIFSRNVSEVHQTQERLKSQEQSHQALETAYEQEHARLEMVMEGVDLGVWFCDLPFSDLDWDARCKAHFGLTPETQVTIDLFYRYILEDDHEATRLAITRSIESAAPYDIVFRTLGPDEILRWIRAVGRTSYNLQGEPVRFDGITLDVSREHQAELARQKMEERCVALVRATSSIVWTCDPQGRFVEPQREWESYTGSAWSKHQGLGWRDCVHPEDLTTLWAGFETAWLNRDLFLAHARLWSQESGAYRYSEFRAVPLMSEGNVLREWIGAVSDVHDRRESELALIHASRMKSQFLANMSHELRTPMAGVQGMLDLLYDTPLTEHQKESLDTIYDCSRSLLAVLDDVLDLSRIEAGKLVLNERVYDLQKKVDKTMALFRLQAQERGLWLRANIEEGVPTALVGDPDRIRQLLTNLVSNALKFTHQGGVDLRVSQRGERLRFAVQDTGIGIADADLAKLFRPFVQVEATTARKYGGTGLGLSIVKRLVELMGGTLAAESVPGQGSTFWFELPIRRPSPADLEKSRLPEAPHRQLPAASVLVVEDNLVISKILVSQLQKFGLAVESVDRGAKAIEAVTAQAFDLIFMDCQMPELDGYQTTARLREQGCRLPIVALTAHAMSGERERCLEAGMDDYLTKPLSLDDLRNKLEQWLLGPQRSSEATESGRD